MKTFRQLTESFIERNVNGSPRSAGDTIKHHESTPHDIHKHIHDHRITVAEGAPMKRFKNYVKEEEFRKHLEDFLEFCAEQLELDELPAIEMIDDKKVAQEYRSFGGYHPGDQSIKVNIAERHRADIFRSLAHELVHFKQHLEDRLDENSGETGSDIENEANARAGIIMRNYARANERLFESYKGNVDAMFLSEAISYKDFLNKHQKEVDKLIKEHGAHAKKFHTYDGAHTTRLEYGHKTVSVNSQLYHKGTKDEMVGHNIFVQHHKPINEGEEHSRHEVRDEQGNLLGHVESYTGYLVSRSKTNRPGSASNKARKLWAAHHHTGRSTWKLRSKKDAIDVLKSS